MSTTPKTSDKVPGPISTYQEVARDYSHKSLKSLCASVVIGILAGPAFLAGATNTVKSLDKENSAATQVQAPARKWENFSLVLLGGIGSIASVSLIARAGAFGNRANEIQNAYENRTILSEPKRILEAFDPQHLRSQSKGFYCIL